MMMRITADNFDVADTVTHCDFSGNVLRKTIMIIFLILPLCLSDQGPPDSLEQYYHNSSQSLRR